MTQETSTQRPQRKSIVQRLRSGFGWTLFGKVGWRSLTALSSILVARILGPIGFGELGILRSTTNVLTTFAVFRLGTTATKHLSEFRESNPQKAARILSMSLTVSAWLCAIFGVVLLFAGGFLAREMLYNPDLAIPLRIGAIFMFCQAYSAVRETILVGFEHFRAYARVNIWKGATTAILVPLGAYSMGVTGAVIGLSLASVISLMFLERYVRAALKESGIHDNIPLREWRAEMSVLWSFALPGLITGFLTVGCFWLGRVHLASEPEGFVELGVFEAANQWRSMVLFLPSSLALAALPIISNAYGSDDKGEFFKVIALQFNGVLAVVLPFSVILICLSDWLMAVFGEAFSAGSRILPVLMVSVVCFALNQSLRKILDGAGHAWRHAAMSLVWAAAFLLPLFAMFENHNALTLAYAYLMAEGAMLAAGLGYVVIVLAKDFLNQTATPLMLAAAACGLALYAFYEHSLSLTVGAVALSLVPLVFLIRRVQA